jgi:hypothetical protein
MKAFGEEIPGFFPWSREFSSIFPTHPPFGGKE